MRKFVSIMLVLFMVFSIAACSQSEEPATQEETTQAETPETPEDSETPEETPAAEEEEAADGQSYTAGKYNGKAQGHNGTLEVEVEFSDDAIVAINVVSSDETEHLSEWVFNSIPAEVIAGQTLSVDSVSGATVSSAALKNAIADAATQANGNLDLLNAPSDKQPSTAVVDLEADVVVIGAGGAGMSAALAAEQNGLSVILLEKTAMTGGHTALSGGFTLVTESELQKRLGVTDDTIESAYEDNWVNGGEKSVPELLQLFCETMGPAADWTVDYVNAAIPDALTKLGENKHDRVLIYTGAGKGFSDALTAKMQDTTIDLYLDTTAKSLITEGADVVGVEAVAKDGTTYNIKAKATILATGSYAARKDLLPDDLQDFVYYGASLSSGDGLEMGEAVGADTVNMGYVELFENGVEWQPGIAKSTYNGSMAAWTVSGILVDLNGERVVNERGSGISIVTQQAAQPNSTLFLLMDQATFDVFREKIGGTGISQEMLDDWLENNGQSSPILAHGATLEEVAQIIGVDVDGLNQTVEKYNQYVEKGVDEDFGRDPDYMTAPIGDGPYYLLEQKPRYATTLGGLLINTDLQVINTDGEVINGLYAIGDTAGGVRGDDSIPGADVAWAVASGYTIGQILPEKLAGE